MEDPKFDQTIRERGKWTSATTAWESNYNRANDVAGRQPTPTTADVTVTKIAGYIRVRILMNRWFFLSYFWHSYFLRYGHFVEYMNMHAMNWCSCGCGGGVDFAPMHEPLEDRC